MTKKKILIATGGTGGHIYPAYSLAKYLMNKNYFVEITTDNRGLKYLKDYKELNLINVNSSSLNKKSVLKFLLSLIIIAYTTVQSFFLLILKRPSIIFGMGGYSSFPICMAASILRIKFIIYENNLIIGKANKYLLPFAKKIFVSYNELEGISEKNKKKVYEIGNIIRKEILEFNNDITKKNILNELKILVLGGSQAAKIFAEELPQTFEKLKNYKLPIKVFQQCQEEQRDQLMNFYKKAEIDCEVFNFTDQIIDYYSKVNLVITRSGASVLGELINMKIPFISIPLPSSADNHQLKNAEFYKKKGYGFLLEEKDIKDKLFKMIKHIFEDKEIYENILLNQSKYSNKDIFTNLSIQIENVLDEKN